MSSPRPLLQVRGLLKRFQGLTATDHADLDFAQGELHALIGPNGAGKTTLINLLSGELAANSGSIVFDGVELTGQSIHQRVHRGLVRSYQITSVFPEFTALQNVMLAVQSAAGHSFNFWHDTRRDARLREPAMQALQAVGLAGSAQQQVQAMPHGARRQLELAMAMALKPRLMLLDEPLAGMSGSDADAMVALLLLLKKQTTIVLVEHDMQAVFALADRITVLVAGKPIATGTPDQIRSDNGVKEAYLGDEAVDAQAPA